MATIVTLTQPQPALFGVPTNFIMGVQNTSGSSITLSSASLVVTDPALKPSTCCNVSPIFVSPELGTAQVGGSQLNVTIPGNTTQYFAFTACFYGQAVAGTPAQAANQFYVSATAVTTDGSASSGALAVNLSTPVAGVVGGGSPPNPALVIGELQFFNPSASVLAL